MWDDGGSKSVGEMGVALRGVSDVEMSVGSDESGVGGENRERRIEGKWRREKKETKWREEARDI